MPNVRMQHDYLSTSDTSGAVCGQAQAVLDNLARTSTLPMDLSLSIEEILERAWEIAYRRGLQPRTASVIAFPARKRPLALEE